MKNVKQRELRRLIKYLKDSEWNSEEILSLLDYIFT